MSFKGMRYKALGVVLLLAVLTIAGCGGGGSGTGNNGKPGNGIKVTVGSKLDANGQLLGAMYILLLRDKGFDVTDKLGLGQTPVLDQAIKSGAVDIYPEFTGTALSVYKLPTTQDPQKAYQEAANYYAKNFNLTWLNPAYNLNDSYGICTSQQVASKYNLKTLDDLVPVASQLTLASQQDGIDAAVNPVKSAYNVNFKKIVQLQETLSFGAVLKGDADLMVCYTTDPGIVTNNFVVLKDTKGVFPVYNPAPVVRNQLLDKSSAVKDALNPLAAKLSTDVMVGLIKQVSVDHKKPLDVAKTYLQAQGMLPK